MTNGTDANDDGQYQEFTELVHLLTRTIKSLHAKDEITIINAERLETVVNTTHEIKEQLVLMNGRVREAEVNIASVKANPSLTRANCDELRSGLDGRVRKLESRIPATIQLIAMGFITGGGMAVVGYLLDRLP